MDAGAPSFENLTDHHIERCGQQRAEREQHYGNGDGIGFGGVGVHGGQPQTKIQSVRRFKTARLISGERRLVGGFYAC